MTAKLQKKAGPVAKESRASTQMPGVAARKGPDNAKPRRTRANVLGRSLARKVAGAEVGSASDLDATKLPMKWQLFVEEYLIDLNGKQAAIRAGFSAGGAKTQASLLLARPVVKAIVQARLEDRIEAIRMTRERVLDEFANIAEADANELCEHRRVCCAHCHGAIDETTGGRHEQFTPSAWMSRRERHEARRQELIAAGKGDVGAFAEAVPTKWYDKRLPINAACFECFGDGIGEVMLKDTRNVSRRARSLFAGVKEGKDGIEIKLHAKDSAIGCTTKRRRSISASSQPRPWTRSTFRAWRRAMRRRRR